MSWSVFASVLGVVGLGVLAAAVVLLRSAALTSREDEEDEAAWEAWRAHTARQARPPRDLWRNDDDAA